MWRYEAQLRWGVKTSPGQSQRGEEQIHGEDDDELEPGRGPVTEMEGA